MRAQTDWLPKLKDLYPERESKIGCLSLKIQICKVPEFKTQYYAKTFLLDEFGSKKKEVTFGQAYQLKGQQIYFISQRSLNSVLVPSKFKHKA